jgi:nucleoside-diphosphate kinase
LDREEFVAVERTFAIIKPDAVKDGHIGEILAAIEASGLVVRGLKLTILTPAICKGFYHEHTGKGFYAELEAFMTEGPVMIMCLEGEGAILKWRDLMGSTDPAKAPEGSLRKRFGTSIGRNATHGSDRPESAAFEVGYFFNQAFDLV